MRRRSFKMVTCATCQQSVKRYSDGTYSTHYANSMRCRPDYVYDPLNTDEHIEQALVISWARSHILQYPCLEWLYSSLNGIPLPGSKKTRGRIMNYMKTEGMTKGVLDLFLPVAKYGYHGIYIEMKKLGGRLSPEQRKFKAFVERQGYLALLCFGHKTAIENLTWYLEDG